MFEQVKVHDHSNFKPRPLLLIVTILLSVMSSYNDDEKKKVQPIRAHVPPRIERPRLPAWRHAALVALLAMLIWLAFYLRPKPTPKVIYASRFAPLI